MLFDEVANMVENQEDAQGNAGIEQMPDHIFVDFSVYSIQPGNRCRPDALTRALPQEETWMQKIRRLLLTGLIAAAIAAPPVATLAAQPVLVPPPGSKERTAILDALRSEQNEDGSSVRFVVHALREVQGRGAKFAYASVEPSKGEYDGGDYILENDGHWRVIWSVTGGGSNTCGDLAAYYLAAIHYLTKHGAAPDLLAPDLRPEQKRLAACDPDLSEVGDMGPEL